MVLVVRSGRRPDEGVVMHVRTGREALRFAYGWRRKHPRDRITILSGALEPLAEFDVDQRDCAQPGSAASGALS